MQITPIIICLVLVSIVQSAWVTRIPKPKLNIMHTQHVNSPEVLKHKSPEERRKLSLFPKSYMKYVISSEPIYQIATHKPMVRETKKPLMKKLNLQDKKNKVVENATELSKINTEPISEDNFAVTSEMDPVVVSEEISIEILEIKSEDSNEHQNDSSDEEDKLNKGSDQIKTADTAEKEFPSLKDLIFPAAKPVEVNPENKSGETLVDVLNVTKDSKENDRPDWMEFIFVDPAHKPTENDKVNSKEPEEYVTTEFYEEPETVRRKRGSNVIEEENLASTVAGYKYTWKDTRLNNDVAFKNIHS